MNKRKFMIVVVAAAAATVMSAAPAKTAPVKPVHGTKTAKADPKKMPGHGVLSAFVPNSYIVELAGDAVVPAANKAAGAKAFKAHDPKLIAGNKARVAREQQLMRGAIEAKGAKVIGSVDTVMNAVFVNYKGRKEDLAAMPGVKQVYQTRRLKRALDRAVINYQARDVWAALGGSPNAGAGVKIGIIDTGIDMTSAAFVDTGFQAPPGYPVADTEDDLALLNNKVIAGRSYATLVCQDPTVYYSCIGSTDPDPTIDDHVGHGTATSSAAAGVPNACDEGTAEANGGFCPFTNTISGAAPGAYLGMYRIFDTENDTTNDLAEVEAINDAVNDGMNVISISIVAPYATRFDQDPEYVPFLNAYAAGVVVVASAGNYGPNFTSITSPATFPFVIAAGAASNDRSFGPAVWAPQIDTNYTLLAGDGVIPDTPIVGPVVDATNLNNVDGCNPFDDGSLDGAVVFIIRGNCNFSVKLDNAQAAGAAGAIIYDTQDDSNLCYQEYGYLLGCVPSLSFAPSTLPAEFTDYYTAAGYILPTAATTPFNIVIGFTDTFPIFKDLLVGFSSTGPNVDLSIKPDVVAIGENVAMNTEQLFYPGDAFGSDGDMFDASGYTIADGTSFSSPFTAGVAAMIMGARPGLTPDQYRSLIINSAKTMLDSNGNLYSNQQIGGGLLNALNAYNSPATVYPTNLGLGVQSSEIGNTQTITLTNVTGNPDSYTFSFASSDGVLQPIVPGGSLAIDVGESQSIPITFIGSGLAPGAYQGSIIATSAVTGAQVTVPYWMAVPSDYPTNLYSICTAVQSCLTDWVKGATFLDAFDFRLVDAAGLPVTDVVPTVTSISGGGTVLAVNSADAPNANAASGDPTGLYGGLGPAFQDMPGLWTVDVRMSSGGGTATVANVFQVTAGDVSQTFVIYSCPAVYILNYGYCP